MTVSDQSAANQDLAWFDEQQVGQGAVKSAVDVISESLRRAIILDQLPGGTRLVQADVAKRMGVSVTPVREALRGLASEGLIDFDRYQGAIVHRPTEEEFREIDEMRCALEPIAVERAVSWMAEHGIDRLGFQRARELVEQMSTTVSYTHLSALPHESCS